MFDVLVSGYVSLDRIVLVDKQLKIGHSSIIKNHDNAKIYYGGCPVNIAYALNKYNISTLPLMRVGSDYESTGFKDFLDSNLIPTDGINKIEGVNTSNCYLVEDQEGNHYTIFYPGAMDNEFFIPFENRFFKHAKLGVITVGPLKDNIDFVEKCDKYNLPIVFGAKLDKTAFPDEFLKTVLLKSRIIFVNEFEEVEINKLFGCSHIKELFESGKAEVIVVTKGTKGSTVYYKEEDQIKAEQVPIVKADVCADTTGSGDAYMAGFMYGYLNGFTNKNSALLGSTLSHFIVQEMGCNENTPSLETLINKFKEAGGKI
ncbi:hypothetical protein CI105_05465 [Candidatus Izimaplasma bacterium ZiA1]|uniref:carbohydrate kinase family protein n=1 Tax=Candidatus Izimoplasma sp. ZiA1 TaxID=2024899 RepID=UPI000BAA7DFA|nr:hypothetical protein CI105_05465 [Candidatus Izimaplasma bacterium ZiA1]